MCKYKRRRLWADVVPVGRFSGGSHPEMFCKYPLPAVLFVCLFVYLFVLQFDVQSDNWIISSGYVECLSVSRRNGVLWLKILPRPHITDQPTKQIFSAMQSSMCTISILSVCVCLCLCVCFVFFSINKCPKGVRILSPSLPACVCLPPHGWVSPWIYPEGNPIGPPAYPRPDIQKTYKDDFDWMIGFYINRSSIRSSLCHSVPM